MYKAIKNTALKKALEKEGLGSIELRKNLMNYKFYITSKDPEMKKRIDEIGDGNFVYLKTRAYTFYQMPISKWISCIKDCLGMENDD